MASNSSISITFNLKDESNGLKTLTLGVADLRKVMAATVEEAEKLQKPFINFAAVCTGIDSLSNTITNLQSTLRGLSDAYALQVTAETQLAVNMRNTMAAREEDIQSIKDLCSAQQELGVIGDEVQLSGAQELATYLSEKQSLEQLIPVMNDMLAQQYGLNASQENASQIATMLGKVMNGQTGALSRYGYSFDDAQEKILKFGTESQRAAVLCEVVKSSVGGMNAELAKTDVGKQKQLENTLGDIKETLGGATQWALPFVSIAAATTTAVGGVIKLTNGLGVLCSSAKNTAVAMRVFWIATGNLTSATTGLTKVVGTARLFISQFCTALGQGTKGLRLFAIAWKGMLVSTGVGIAIAAVTSVIAYFALKTDEATKSTNNLLNAEERAKRNAEQLELLRQQENSTLTSTRAALEINISKLKEFNGTKEQEKKLVNEMNDTYGDTMGYFSSVADWYDALIANSEAYCRQMVLEARTRTLANQIAEKEQENYNLIYDDEGKIRRYGNKRETQSVGTGTATIGAGGGFSANIQQTHVEIPGTSEVEKVRKVISDNDAIIKSLNTQMEKAVKEAAGINFKVEGSKTRSTDKDKKTDTTSKATWTADPKTLKEYTDNIKVLDDKLQNATKDEATLINQQKAAFQKEADEIRNAGIALVDPKELNTLDDFDAKLRYLNDRRKKASNEQLASLDKEIKRVKELRDEFEGVSNVPEPPAPIRYHNTLEELSKAESTWREIQQKGSVEEILNAQKEIDKINEKKEALLALTNLPSLQLKTDQIERNLNNLNGLSGKDLTVKLRAMGVDQIQDQIDTVSQMIEALSKQMSLVGIGDESYNGLNDLRYKLRGVRDELEGYKEQAKNADEIQKAQNGAVNALTGSFSQLGSAIGGAAGQWLQYGANLAQTIAAAIPRLTALASAHDAKAKEETKDAAAGAAAAVAGIPFVGPALAVAAVASIITALISIPKFANGGIVGGASLSGDKLMARVNSGEMILNRSQQASLFKMLNTGSMYDQIRNLASASTVADKVTFKIEGRTLVGILEKESNIKYRS